MRWLKELKYRFVVWIVAVVEVLLVDPCMWVLNRLPVRKYLCWLLGHRYRGICFKSNNPDVYVEVADTEHGCVFCGRSKPNEHWMNAKDIDFERTKHRTTPPKHCVFPWSLD